MSPFSTSCKVTFNPRARWAKCSMADSSRSGLNA